MKAKVYSHKILIGTVDLKIGDRTMGHLYGDLIPSENYFSEIQNSIWEFNTSLKRNYSEYQSLRFNIQLENGYFLFPAGGYEFSDHPDFKNEPIRLDIPGVPSVVIDDFFEQDSAKKFTEVPWHPVKIEQKISFEDELKRELGDEKEFLLSSLINRNKHPLSDFNFSALCHDQRNDDVLFITRKAGSEDSIALVHLTWKMKKEIKNYPITFFYKDFEDFRQRRMIKDVQEFN